MRAATPHQREAIEAGGNVLVVAGAGTGKTRTLVERCLRLVIAEGCSLAEMLLVTFTEAAAAEMRQRIREALLERQRQQPDDERLGEQIALLDTAHICTMHSFCLHLAREHFDELDIDPEVMVLDDRQAQPLIQETLDELLAAHYAGDSELSGRVRDLIRRQGRGSDEGIRSLILQVHRYTQSLPNPEMWFELELSRLREPGPALWEAWLREGFEEWSALWQPILAEHPGQIEAVGECLHALDAVRAAFRDGGAAPAREIRERAMRELARVPAAKVNKDLWPRGTKTTVGKALKKLFDEAEFLHQAAEVTGDRDALAEDWEWVRHDLVALLELARKFTEEFSRAKRELGGADFADLEQFALRLLCQPGGSGVTATAEAWRKQLRHVFVDEYQDINAAQDAILTAVSRERAEANRFLVGDVKQSIYRFRRANPQIFRKYETDWGAEGSGARRVPLADNFRSRAGLLEVVNSFFRMLMRPGIGGVAYGQDAELRFGNPAGRKALLPATEAGSTGGSGILPRTELHLLTSRDEQGSAGDAAAPFGVHPLGCPGETPDEPGANDSESADLLAAEKEARCVALRLRAMQAEGHRVWDEQAGQERPVCWGDMVVLLRSPSAKVEAYAKEFHRAGVPLQASRGGFLQALEVMDLLNLLHLLDNPLQDVPLLAVLRSPLVGMSLAELAEIRAHSRERLFWTALVRFHHSFSRGSASEAHGTDAADNGVSPASPVADEARRAGKSNEGGGAGTGGAAWAKADLFLRQFDTWRELMRQTSLSYCLEAALAATHYEALLGAEPRGVERVANVRRLVSLARQFDPYQRQGLHRFLRFLELQDEAGQEFEPAPQPAADAVQLMSIHKSKGLEFPVVVLADLGKAFNLGDLQTGIMLDEQYGLCASVTPPGADCRYPSLPLWLARRRERCELLGEEMRLLYVAMTRARDTLLLSGTLAGKSADAKIRSGVDALVGEREIQGVRSCLDWILQWFARVTKAEDWAGTFAGQNQLLRWCLYSENDPRLAVPAVEPENRAADADANLRLDAAALAGVCARVEWAYPFPAAAVEPAKRSVTGLVRALAYEEEEAEPWGESRRAAFGARVRRPRQEGTTELTAAEAGTAHHLFLQHLSIERAGSLAEIEAEAQRLEAARVLSPAQLAALDLGAVLAFWDSEAGRWIRAQAAQVRREVPFTARFKPGELAGLGLAAASALPGDELIVVQGVVDLAVLLPEEIRLVDFKTDDVRKSELAARAAQYAPQLKLYSAALERIYRRPVTRRWLRFLSLNQTVEM